MKWKTIILSCICIAALCAVPFLKFEKSFESGMESKVIVSLAHVTKIKGASGFLTKRALEFNKQYPNVFILVCNVTQEQLLEKNEYDMISVLNVSSFYNVALCYNGRVNISSEFLSNGSSGNQLYGLAWCKSGEDVQYFCTLSSKKQLYINRFIEYVTSDSAQEKLSEIKAEGVL